ncbi:hypothetical protein JNW88_19995 [Micromonospora sp. ATA32]|nr:hypothetical protein [Micromonospora sp. ATA32]
MAQPSNPASVNTADSTGDSRRKLPSTATSPVTAGPFRSRRAAYAVRRRQACARPPSTTRWVYPGSAGGVGRTSPSAVAEASTSRAVAGSKAGSRASGRSRPPR